MTSHDNRATTTAIDAVTAGGGREELVSEAFVALADTLVDDYDVIELLDRLVAYSVAILAADAAGILLGDARDELQVVASSSEDAELMELLAVQAQDSPCLDCYHRGAPVSVPDLAEAQVADRWPGFTAQVSARGAFRSVHALPLRLRGQAIGVLSLFHGTPGALPAADLALGQALADVATIGILSERTIRSGEVLSEQLQTALNSRVIIEQAKGVLANRGSIDMLTAFDRMRRHSRHTYTRLGVVARQVVAGEVDLDTLLNPPASAPKGTRRT